MSRVDTDVAVIGGGPAGASTAAYLAKAGIDCTVFESELFPAFPRRRIAGSVVDARIRDLGFMETMEAAGFPRKYGAVWTAVGNSRAFSHEWEGLAAAEQPTSPSRSATKTASTSITRGTSTAPSSTRCS